MTVRVFIATSPGEDDLVSERVLEYSLRKNCSEDIEVVFMRNNDDPNNFFGGFNNQGWATPFTNLRWAIPEYCNFEGRAIYMDVDMVNFRDISELFHVDMKGKPLVCREGWRTCVMVMDCEKLKKYLPSIDKIKKDAQYNQRNAKKFSAMAETIDPRWNCLDGEGRALDDIWHLHWTHMPTQPWHPGWARKTHEDAGIKWKPMDHPRLDLVKAWNAIRREAMPIEHEHTVVTTMPSSKWEEFGAHSIPSFDRYWPKNIKLKVYLEGEQTLPVKVSDRIQILNMEEELPEIAEFEKRNNHRSPEVGNLDAAGPFRKQASKFCRKAYAILKELESPESRYVWFMDADVETLRDVPEGLLAHMVDYGTYVGCLPRKHGVDGLGYTETGFGFWDTKNPWHKVWCKNYRACWDDDLLFNFPMWIDCLAFDYATDRLTKYGKVQVYDIADGASEHSSHPLNDGPLGTFFNHKKGRRKLK
jgi:hypothetical protein